MRGKALRRAIASDAIRLGSGVPLLTDSTELITPAVAQDLLTHNKNNRPVNWHKVEEYAASMKAGEWQVHSQGIILDVDGNILTGQKRLWAVVVSGCNIYMRVSRGNPRSVGKLLDRGTPQSSRDLASRDTGRVHSPTEASIVRAYCALMGNTKPTPDVIAECMSVNDADLAEIVRVLKRTKKTKAVLMAAGAVMAAGSDDLSDRALKISVYAERLSAMLLPHTPEQCWNKGAAFGLAMEKAMSVVMS